MTTTIISAGFNGVQFDEITRNHEPWLRVNQIGLALGYKNPDLSIAKVFRSHADEFTDSMTALVTLPTPGGPQETRIFSLRGCHLLAMFARTSVAKAFRVWVLDVLETLNRAERQAPALESTATPSTPADRAPLRSLVHAWAQAAMVHHSVLWPQVKAHFQLSSIEDLPVEWIPDALAFVQGKIDEGQRQKALPAVPVEDPDATRWHRNIREDLSMVLRIVEKLCCDAVVYLPQGGTWSQLEMMERVNASVGRVLKNLYEAKSHLRDANAMTLRMARR